LPDGGGRALTDYRPSLVVLVQEDGAVRVAGKPFTDEQVDNLFRAVFIRDVKTEIVVKAHRAVPHRRVVDILERAKQSGLTRFAIGTSDDT
jgi:biopolymer transport protein ExbD